MAIGSNQKIRYPLPYILREDVESSIEHQIQEGINKGIEDKISIIRKEFDEKSKVLEAQFNANVERRAGEIVSSAMGESGGGSGLGSGTPFSTSSKIAKMIDEIKRRKAAAIEPPVVHTPIPLVSPDQAIEDKHRHDSLDCPTCQSGSGDHDAHHMVPTGDGYVKCEGPDCGEKGFITFINSDYRCSDCGAPMKRARDPVVSSKQSCHMCGSKKATKYNWAEKAAKLRAAR